MKRIPTKDNSGFHLRLSGPNSRFMYLQTRTYIFSTAREYIRSAIVWQSLFRDFTFIHDAHYHSFAMVCSHFRAYFTRKVRFLAFAIHQSTRKHVSFGIQWIISENLFVVFSYF